MSVWCCLCGQSCLTTDKITVGKWQKIKEKCRDWSGLDKFGDVFNTTQWEIGPENQHAHSSCYITLCSSVKLEQARYRLKKKRGNWLLFGSRIWLISY